MADIKQVIESLYRAESRRVFATLVRLLGDFDLAEDSTHEAFVLAAEKWPESGIPENPVAWLISAGRFRSIDAIRRGSKFEGLQEHHPEEMAFQDEPEVVGDEVLRLIFTCCHPAISFDAQVALTLREVCELTTEEIAQAFLIPVPTLAQRIVRAKAKIRDAQIPFEVPEADQLADRLDSVLKVIYLVYNEGYYASGGDTTIRRALVSEAIRLTRLLTQLLPEGEVFGLLGLMLLHESRRNSRLDSNGDLIILEHQDRSLWDKNLIVEGNRMIERALETGRAGTYTIQAAISAVHADAARYEDTDWTEIIGLYDALLVREPSPVIELNRAVAIAMRDGPEVGLALVDDLLNRENFSGYYPVHVARAEFCAKLDSLDEAKRSYELAISMVQQETERRYLMGQLEKIKK